MINRTFLIRSSFFSDSRRPIFLNSLANPGLSEIADIKRLLQSPNESDKASVLADIGRVKNDITGMLFDASGKISPKLRDEYFRKLRQIEPTKIEELVELKMSLSEELEQRETNRKNYENLFNKAENKEHFSEKSREEYFQSFEDISLQQQQEWIKKFEITEVPARAELTKKFRMFGSEHQSKYSGFFEKSRHEKKAIIEQMEIGQINQYHYALFKGPLAQYACRDSSSLAYAWFVKGERTIEERKNALKMLDTQLNSEAAQCRKYDALPQKTKNWIQNNFKELFSKIIKPQAESKAGHPFDHKKTPENFRDLSAEERDVLLDYANNNKEKVDQDEKLEGKYNEVLEKAYKEHILGKETFNLYKKWFKKELKKGKDHAQNLIDNFPRDPENIKRIHLLKRFEELPENVKKTSAKEFYEASYSKRLHLYQKLNGELNKSKTNPSPNPNETKNPEDISAPNHLEKQIAVMKYSAAHLENYQQWTQAIKMYESILELDPNQKDAKTRLEFLKKNHAENKDTPTGSLNPEVKPENIRSSLQKIIAKPTLKKKREALTLTKLVVLLAENRERYHQGISDNLQRNTNLNQEERTLQQTVQENTDGKMTLEKKGAEVTAKKIERINVRRLYSQNDEPTKLQFQRLKEGCRDFQGNTGKAAVGMEGLQIVDEKNDNLTALAGKEQADQLDHELRDNLIEEIAQDLGQPLTLPLIRAIEQELRNTNLSTNLQETA